MSNIISLHGELAAKTYIHSTYQPFKISDPKPRNIHKASVRDRLLHHALYRKLYPFFDKTFISDSYSCRIEKGTHRAMNRFRTFGHRVSNNNKKTVWVLKGDIRQFFASIDQTILINILKEYIPDQDITGLLSKILQSFHSVKKGIGLPLGNLTSQLLVNMYMNEFDQFMKHALKAKYYIRYADDFIVLSQDRLWLNDMLFDISDFLWTRLRLKLHPKKISIGTLASGIDFLGWAHFSDYRILRTVTKRRMYKKLRNTQKPETLASYRGLLSHGNSKKIKEYFRTFDNIDDMPHK